MVPVVPPQNGAVRVSQDALCVPVGGHAGLGVGVAEDHHQRVSCARRRPREDAAEAKAGGVLFNGVRRCWRRRYSQHGGV